MNLVAKGIKAACYRLLSALLLATCLLQAPAYGLADTASLKQAVSTLEQFQKKVSSMRQVVAKPLGPYQIGTQCTWCSERAWWGFGLCTRNTTQTWYTTVDFTWSRQMLDRVLKQAEQNAGTFSSSYAPTQAWIDGLPGFSADFDSTANVITAVQQQIAAGAGPTDEQRVIVTQALQKLTDGLGRSSAQLQVGTQSLAGFLQQQSSYQAAIRQAMDGADRSAQDALNRIESDAKNQRCQDGVQEKFASIRADFARSMQEISQAFQDLEASNREAQRAQAVLLGSVVTSQTDMQSILEMLKAARNDQLGSFLERLHLSAAQKQWKDLADDYRQMKFSASR